ncbi:unnamed protein product [Prorocentrum cordatum]|uniref:Phytanoyl-CoA dioxygenase n=1 Tax=Prorocentrum cordatum TaxID=2364126 RepID=A0ABN9VLG2_9DINO|nr:unnamed protein product [Polarella glacialis]
MASNENDVLTPLLALHSEHMPAKDSEMLGKLAQKSVELVTKALGKDASKSQRESQASRLNEKGKKEQKEGKFQQACIYSNAASLLAARPPSQTYPRRMPSMFLNDLGGCFLAWFQKTRRWGFALGAAAAIEMALIRDPSNQDSPYNNAKALTASMQELAPDQIGAGHCRLLLCPSAEGSVMHPAVVHRPSSGDELKWQMTRAASLDPVCANNAPTVVIDDAERDAGVLRQDTFEHAVAALSSCGVAVLKNAYRPEIIAELASAQEAEFARVQAEGLLNDSTITVPAGKEGRYNVKAPFRRPFIGEAYVDNPIVMGVLYAAMGGVRSNDVEVATLSHVTSLPHSPPGNWHGDHSALFQPNERYRATYGLLPAHACIAIVPLANISMEMGPTRFLLKSHLPCMGERRPTPVGGGVIVDACYLADTVLDGVGDVGDALLFDMRILHQGSGNDSPNLRPTMYTTYAQKWFLDSANWNVKHTAAFDSFPGDLRRRLSRLDSEDYLKKLEALLEERGVDVNALQSSYFYNRFDITMERDDRIDGLIQT